MSTFVNLKTQVSFGQLEMFPNTMKFQCTENKKSSFGKSYILDPTLFILHIVFIFWYRIEMKIICFLLSGTHNRFSFKACQNTRSCWCFSITEAQTRRRLLMCFSNMKKMSMLFDDSGSWNAPRLFCWQRIWGGE